MIRIYKERNLFEGIIREFYFGGKFKYTEKKRNYKLNQVSYI